MKRERVAGALCTWAVYDIYRRWNGPTQVALETTGPAPALFTSCSSAQSAAKLYPSACRPPL